MRLLNLGCGNNFHKDWTNIDFVSSSEHVINYNLLDGIPADNNSTDVIYHSHVLEHFSKSDGIKFLQECYRVLKVGGILRIAVPDLETIVKEYLQNLELAVSGDEKAMLNYEWITLELFDQMVRNKSGGYMADYLHREDLPNEDYVYKRIGMEGKKISDSFLKKDLENLSNSNQSFKIKKILSGIKRRFKNYYKKKLNKSQSKALKIGQFRLGGEIHQWMYDRYSLSQVLKKVGFKEVKICSAFESDIKNWNSYQLDVVNGEIRKPDSLFVEAKKL